MNPKVSRLLERLQNDQKQLLAKLDTIDHAKLETPVSEGVWSATQVMYHLNQAESLSIIYVKKKRLGAAQLKNTGLEAELRLLFARISFTIPAKYHAPKFLGDMPEHVVYKEIKQAWQKTRTDLTNLIESLTDEELRKPIFKQPFFGRWNIFQMLGFMQIHFNRHRKQIVSRLN